MNPNSAHIPSRAQLLTEIAELRARLAAAEQAASDRHESEQRLRLFIEHAPAALAMFDRELRYLAVSRRWRGDFPPDREEPAGVEQNHLSPDIPSRLREIHGRVLSGEVISVDEDQFPGPGGAVQWLRWEARPWYLDVGQIGGIVVFAEDITIRKHAEDRVIRAEQRLRLALDAAYLISFEWDIQRDEVRRYVSTDPSLPETPEGAPSTFEAVCQVVHRADRDRFVANVQAALQNQDGRYESEFRIVHPDGQIAWLYERGRVERDADGRPLRLIGLSQDITVRRQAEQALRESEERFAGVVNSAMDAIVSMDEQQRVCLFNPAAEQMFALSAAEALGQPLTRFIPESFRQDDADRLPFGAAQGEAGRRQKILGELRGLRANGEEFPVEASISQVTTQNGHMFTAVVRDISLRLKADQALRESLARTHMLGDLVMKSSQPVGVGHPDGHLILANRAFVELTGYDEEELYCLDWAKELTPPEWREAEDTVLAELLRTGQPVRYRKEYRTKDGSRIPIELLVHLVRDAEGQPLHFYAFVTDIRERLRAETALRESEERERQRAEELQTILDTAPIGLSISLDPAGLHIRGNRANEEMFGLPRGAEMSKAGPRTASFRIFQHGRELDVRELPMQRALRGESVPEQIMDVRRADGLELTVYAKAAPLFDDAGRARGAVGAFLDITALRRAEAGLRAAHDTFRHLVENSPFGIYAVDADFRLVQVSVGARKVFANVDPLIGRDLAEALRVVWPESFASEAIARFRHTLATGEPYHAPRSVERRRDSGELESYDWKIERVALPDGGLGAVCHFYDLSERQRYEEALRDSERHLRLALQAAKAGVWEWDVNTDRLEWSPENLDLYGLPADTGSLCFADWARLVHADDLEPASAAVRLALEGVTSELRIEFRVVLPDGTLRWLLGFGHVERAADGTPLRMLGINLDITEQKLAEVSLLQSESFYRQTLESIPGMVFTTRADGYCDYQSQPWVNYTGVPMKKHLGDGWSLLLHPDDRPRALAAWRAAVAGQSAYDLEYRVRRHDGVYEWFRVIGRPIQDGDGQIVRWFGVALNIDQLKQTEQRLRRSEERFRQIFEHAATGMAMTDWSGRFLQCNPAYCELLEYTEAELTQLQFADLIHPDDRAANMEKTQQLRDERVQYFAIENRYVRKGGATVWVRKFVSLLRNDAGTPTHILALVADITEQRRMEQALREADRRKDEFLATLAHELRNPLAPISNALQVLRLKPGDEALRERFLDMMQRQVAHLTRLVDDLLEVSRISRGKIDLVRSVISLDSIISNAIETSRPLIDAGAHRLTVTLPPEPVLIDADPVRLAQVFSNLLNNAARYTEPGGDIVVSAQAQDGKLTVSVRDNGIGIATEELPRVFELFAQIDRSGTRKLGGLGIGLALVRSLVQLHGGTVEARSAGLGQGSEFTVELPMLGFSTPEQSTVAGTVAVLARHRLLVVDDNQDAADSLAQLLGMRGATVQVVYDGPAALRAVDTFNPSGVILDLGMPDMDGFEVARRIRQQPRHQDIVLIALTGWGQEIDRHHSRSAGFDHHLVKPADIDHLQALLAPL